MPDNKIEENEGFRVSLDDLIKANLLQKALAEATIMHLRQAKSDAEELKLFRGRERRNLEQAYNKGESNAI